jgi:hypothetical protein
VQIIAKAVDDEEINVNPVLNFFFALKAPESKRTVPKEI